MKLIAHVSVCFPYSNSWTRRVSSSSQQPLLSRISSAALLLLLACVFVPVASQAQVTITVPGPTSPSIQITGAVPMRVVVNSGNSFAVDHVQVLDGWRFWDAGSWNSASNSFLSVVGLRPLVSRANVLHTQCQCRARHSPEHSRNGHQHQFCSLRRGSGPYLRG